MTDATYIRPLRAKAIIDLRNLRDNSFQRGDTEVAEACQVALEYLGEGHK
jgi:hypothetical protein